MRHGIWIVLAALLAAGASPSLAASVGRVRSAGPSPPGGGVGLGRTTAIAGSPASSAGLVTSVLGSVGSRGSPAVGLGMVAAGAGQGVGSVQSSLAALSGPTTGGGAAPVSTAHLGLTWTGNRSGGFGSAAGNIPMTRIIPIRTRGGVDPVAVVPLPGAVWMGGALLAAAVASRKRVRL